MKHKQALAAIAIVVSGLLSGLLYLTHRERAFSRHWHDEVSRRIQKIDDYAANAAQYDHWFDAQHAELFARHYSAFSGFDGEAYLAAVFRATADRAAADGFAEQAERLRELHGSMLYQIN
ncbi:MAG: hypothetical protein ACF8LK_03575 [Phycisphaerales bacterium JB041]